MLGVVLHSQHSLFTQRLKPVGHSESMTQSTHWLRVSSQTPLGHCESLAQPVQTLLALHVPTLQWLVCVQSTQRPVETLQCLPVEQSGSAVHGPQVNVEVRHTL